MQGELIHIKYGKIDFKCPYCGHTHFDIAEIYLNRINKNKRGYTWTHCNGSECVKRFGISADMTGDLVSFKMGNTTNDISGLIK